MDDSLQQLIQLANLCKNTQNDIRFACKIIEKSKTTKEDYIKLAKTLLTRTKNTEDSVNAVIRDTKRNSTFYKRMAALRHYLNCESYTLAAKALDAKNETEWRDLIPQFQEHLNRLKAFLTLKKEGFTLTRGKRKSKRQALTGLPKDWRTVLCDRGAEGKYGTALLAIALTGARPQELVSGIKIYYSHDDLFNRKQLCFEIESAKVKLNQGQPNRKIVYDAEDENPLVRSLVEKLDLHNDSTSKLKIANSTNFTVEVRRLAATIWPEHKHSITAYCFRHQWSADIKAMGNSEDVSKGLGHISTKTQKYYGTKNQASSADRLRPILIEADRPIRQLHSQFHNHPSRTLEP
jgi:hypothetical protein